MKRLFICSTYYHTLITCIKAMSGIQTEIAVTDYIPEAEGLSERLQKSGLFGKVMLLHTPREYKPANAFDKLFFLHSRNRSLVSRQLTVDLSGYDEINIFHDDTWFARYLKDARIPYVLIEDALDSFKSIDQSVFGYMTKNGPKQWIKKLLGYGYVFVDQCPCVQSIEVNSADGLDFSCEVKEVPRKPMFDSLSEADRKKLADIFLPDVHDESALHGTLILTQPFADDGLMSLERQKEIFAGLSRSYPDAVIKPHPRDIADYSDLGCPMLPKNVPFEVIEMCCSPHYSLAVSVSSTAVNGLRCADEKLLLGMDHIK